MAEVQQSQSVPQPQAQHQQAQGQPAPQALPRRGHGAPPGIARRGGSMVSRFALDPFEMLRTSPFALMRRFTEDLEHWFAQRDLGWGGSEMAGARGGFFAPAVDVFDRDGHFVVWADLPGLTKDDVRVEVTEHALVLEGERRSEHEDRQGGAVHSERHYGMFRRQIPLPEGVQVEQATATFKDGVLEITMPAPDRQAQSRRIAIHEVPSSPAAQAERGSAAPTARSTEQDHAQTAGQSAS